MIESANDYLSYEKIILIAPDATKIILYTKDEKYKLVLTPTTITSMYFMRLYNMHNNTYKDYGSANINQLNDFLIHIWNFDTSIMKYQFENCEIEQSPITIQPRLLNMQEQFKSYVYFIQGADKIKIGISQSPKKRLATLQCTSPIPLKMLAICKGGTKLEKKLHKQFKHLRSHGEWFRAEPELLSYIEQYLAGYQSTPVIKDMA